VLDWLPWQDAAGGAGATLAATLGLRHRRQRSLRALAAWGRELTAMAALYALWQLAGDLSVTQGGGAVARGRAIWGWERRWHLPSEAAAQHLLLGHHDLIRLANIYYAQVHVPALGVCLVWLFARHRDRYPVVRNVVIIVTGLSLLIQLLPVAPPRLVPGLGVTDTGHLIGPSVYPSSVAPGLDQLSAMPSLHVGWAIIVAGAIIFSLRSPWRWLAATYPVTTALVVVVTGNHYWSDGIVAVGLCGLALVIVTVRRPARAPSPVDLRVDSHPAPVSVGAGGSLARSAQVRLPASGRRHTAGPSKALRSAGQSVVMSHGRGSAAEPDPDIGLGLRPSERPALPPRPR
jgi:hypothetical protein